MIQILRDAVGKGPNGKFELLDARHGAQVKRVVKALAANGASNDQVVAASTLQRAFGAPSVPIASNVDLCRYAALRTYSSLLQVDNAEISKRFRVLHICDGSDPTPMSKAVIDYKAVRSAFMPYLKEEAENFIAVPCPTACSGGFKMRLAAIVWGPGTTSSQKTIRRPRKSKRPVHAVEETFEIADSTEDLAAAAAYLWNLTGVAEMDVVLKKGRWKPPKTTDTDLESELACFVLRASMRLDRIAFGYGAGKTVLKSVLREVVTRAASFDIVEKAIVPPAGIARFLADLPSRTDGDRCMLPIIRHL